MLDLQRASAGSGKTYALTKYFIRFLIAVREEGSDRYRLRTRPEIEDGLPRILAITFTNKATNEMQMRIVDKLDALASYTGADGEPKPDYMSDFEEEFGASPQQIGGRAGIALKTLLNNFSDFNVSTIDSFFQLVLRTLAYESGLVDSYQVELESDYVSKVGLDAVLDDVDNAVIKDGGEVREWLGCLMNNTQDSKWNVFQKSEPTNGNSKTPYKSLLADFNRIDSEDFRQKREELESYLKSESTLTGLYREFEQRYYEPQARCHASMQESARRLIRLCGTPDLRNGRKLVGKPFSVARKILDAKPAELAKNPPAVPGEEFWEKKIVADAILSDPAGWQARRAEYESMTGCLTEWLDMMEDPMVRLWMSLRVSFPFLGLLKAVMRKRREYLNENNSLELGDTSFILNSIIAPSDTPFVYERLGTKLNHFLIDEFQDTSALQWANLRPLIENSLAESHDNLIIGDAKQSIYRFRNAEPELINTRVKRELGDDVNVKGDSEKENTNWRSDRRVVEWNNSLFRFVTGHLKDFVNRGEAGNMDVHRKFTYLYGNVCQRPRCESGGYVRVMLCGAPPRADRKNAGELPEPPEPARETSVEDMALELVLDALRRGYRQKDICILSRSNRAGIRMVECMRAYNNRREKDNPATPHLEFVSEQSLLVANSIAVQYVETVLDTVARGTMPKLNEPSDRARRGAGNIHDLECHVMMYRQRHPELSMAECMERFLDSEPDSSAIERMMSEMQTTALPALVEAAIARFVPESLRRSDAPFLAAFQDAVLEYCDGHPSDLPSFVDWWGRKRKKLSISSPEDTDAIQVMTSHKSKGLEFPVVIITQPESKNTCVGDYVSGKEWQWVPRDMLVPESDPCYGKFPPYMPVNITGMLAGTPLESLLYEEYDKETQDTINLLYVAFTRAVNELYVFTPVPSKDFRKEPSRTLGGLLTEFAESGGPACDSVEEALRVTEEGGNIVMEYGLKPERKRKKEKKGESAEHAVAGVLEDYRSTDTPDCIKCREESLPEYVDSEDYDEEDSRDPRSMGNVCHAIMEGVEKSGDLEREILRAEVLGLLPENSGFVDDLRKSLTRGGPQVARWFGGGCRVISERPLLHRGHSLRRPDRIMIWPDGSVDIVDYKFGKREGNEKRHYTQVDRYARRMRETGRYGPVRGWVWYVMEPEPGRRIMRVQ